MINGLYLLGALGAVLIAMILKFEHDNKYNNNDYDN